MTKYYEARSRLVDRLIKEGILRTGRYIEAMSKVPRHLFVWPGYEDYAYMDNALPLGDTGQTISAPHMCAYMLEALKPMPGDYILEIGSGSGYQAALLAEAVAPAKEKNNMWGHVLSLEIVNELVEFARNNISRAGYSDKIIILHKDGTVGYPPYYKKEIYDKILVTAAAPKIPKMLLHQLKRGGMLVIPVGNLYMQRLTIVEKRRDGSIKAKETLGCMFVPLKGKNGW
jgi:protein-L-isoaspartate(D-aspartate) O-methyltransferase